MYVNEMPLRFSASVTSSVMTFLSHLDVGWVKRCACIKWIILVLRSGVVPYACVFLEIQTRCSRYHHNCRTIFFCQRFIIQMNAKLRVQLRPCLIAGKWIPGIHFPCFPMFGSTIRK
jgi:hypothetical protein